QSQKPGIFSVQEALINQVNDLEKGVYKHAGVGRDDGKSAGEFSAIFYDTTQFTLKAENTFWLSETPEKAGSMGWDAACVRITTWVKLLDSKSGKSFFVFNTHFDHVGDTARLESAKLIKLKIDEIAGDNPVILTGDFNCRKGSAPYNVITEVKYSLPLSDSRYHSKNQDHEPEFSFVGSNFEGEQGNIIDHIFLSHHWKINQSGIINNCSNHRCPSDHLPVVAHVELL
ncbi:MAG: endonuclease/exonuclease/phosphatase family protein, partial [Bacteroidales bacterium]|nr:endonuclease/exonuclease/phosphatase family protein [Bacteroidales bacterium]